MESFIYTIQRGLPRKTPIHINQEYYALKSIESKATWIPVRMTEIDRLPDFIVKPYDVIELYQEITSKAPEPRPGLIHTIYWSKSQIILRIFYVPLWEPGPNSIFGEYQSIEDIHNLFTTVEVMES